MNLFTAASHRRSALNIRQFVAETAGSEMVEFALSVSLLLMVMFGIIDGSRLVYAHHFVAQAAEAGVRYASTRGSTWTNTCANSTTAGCVASATNISAFVLQTATIGISSGNLTVVPTWAGTTPGGDNCNSDNIVNAPGCLVSVKVSYAFQFTLPFLPHLTITMSSSAAGVVQQ